MISPRPLFKLVHLDSYSRNRLTPQALHVRAGLFFWLNYDREKTLPSEWPSDSLSDRIEMQDLVTGSNERASGIAKDALWSILSFEQGARRWLFNT